MRVAIADDSVLLREGLSPSLYSRTRPLRASVTAIRLWLFFVVELDRPDVALIDIRMPPTFTHEGAQAAAALRARWPSLGILLLSQSIESTHARAGPCQPHRVRIPAQGPRARCRGPRRRC